MIFGPGKRDICFKISEVRLVKDLNKNLQIKYKKNAFSMNHFDQNFHFFSLAVIFSIFLDGIKKRGSSVVRHLPLVLDVPGSIPACGEENLDIRTRFF